MGAPEFSPTMDPRTRETSASVTRSIVAGNVAPVDFTGLSVPVVSGIQFSAVAVTEQTCHNGHLCKEDTCSIGTANPSLFNLECCL